MRHGRGCSANADASRDIRQLLEPHEDILLARRSKKPAHLHNLRRQPGQNRVGRSMARASSCSHERPLPFAGMSAVHCGDVNTSSKTAANPTSDDCHASLCSIDEQLTWQAGRRSLTSVYLKVYFNAVPTRAHTRTDRNGMKDSDQLTHCLSAATVVSCYLSDWLVCHSERQLGPHSRRARVRW